MASWPPALNATIAVAQEASRMRVRDLRLGQSSNSSLDPYMVICYPQTLLSTKGLFNNQNPLEITLPLLMFQSLLVIVLTRTLHFLSRWLRQPIFVAELLGGIIMGPSVLCSNHTIKQLIFPLRSITVLQTFSSIGLLYFSFVLGVQLDLSTLLTAEGHAWTLAVAGLVLPLGVLTVAFVTFGRYLPEAITDFPTILCLAASVSITAHPVLLRILAQRKLLHTPTGKTAMSMALINGTVAWAIFLADVGLWAGRGTPGKALEAWATVAATAVVLYWVVRLVAKSAEEKLEEGVGEVHVMLSLVAIMACGVVGDTVGVHPVFGSFIMGVAMPRGKLSTALVEGLEDFVTGFMMPLCFAVIGLKVDVFSLIDSKVYLFLFGVLLFAAIARLVVILILGNIMSMTFREALSLGILVNSKGIMEVLILQIAHDKRIIDRQSFAVLVLVSFLLTSLTSPLVTYFYRARKDYFAAYKRRMIQGLRPDQELRMLACVHTARNVPSLVRLLDMANPSKRSPITLYALQLVELTSRESAMLVVHDANKIDSGAVMGMGSRVHAQLEQIVKGFREYVQTAAGVSVQTLTMSSPYSSMHEDVGNVADDKHAVLLILPYHKQHTVDGGMEVVNPGILTLNNNALTSVPCSVAIFIDRSLGARAESSYQVAVMFVGGPDDREAVSLAMRMADNPSVSLTLIRFVDANQKKERDEERMRDDECVKEFRIRTMAEEKVLYVEKVVETAMDMVAAIRSLESVHDLYIVGRGVGVESQLTAGMTEWAESPELGVVGDLLCSSDFTAAVSLLVVQQYRGEEEGPGSPGGAGYGGSVMSKSSSRNKGVGWDP